MSMNHDFLMHHGVKGQKWGVRRYQNPDGSMTEAGKKRYSKLETKVAKQQLKVDKNLRKQDKWEKKQEFYAGFGLMGSHKRTFRAYHKSVKAKQKAARGERKINKYLEEMEKLNPVQHSSDLPDNEIVDFIDSLDEEQKTFFECLMDDLLAQDDEEEIEIDDI